MGARAGWAASYASAGLKVIFDPEPIGDVVHAFQHQIGHDFGDFGGHAKANFETTIGDKVPGPVGQRYA